MLRRSRRAAPRRRVVESLPGERPSRDEAQPDRRSGSHCPGSSHEKATASAARPSASAATARQRLQSRSPASAAPESSLFAMNPRAGACLKRGPYAAAPRLETSTTAGGSGRAATRSATAIPSIPGNCTSRSTTAGRSAATASIAPIRPPPRRRPRTLPPRAAPERRHGIRHGRRRSGRSGALRHRRTGETPHTVAGTELRATFSRRSSPRPRGWRGVAAARRCPCGTRVGT